MTKICFLHLGFHKTATTSIQLTCRNNSTLLKKNGVETPNFLNERNRISANHTGQLRDIFSPSNKNLYNKVKHNQCKPGHSNSLESYIYEFQRLLDSTGHIFLSGEGIPLFPKVSLIRMVDEIEAHGFIIHPFALVRTPYAYLNSALQQTIKGGKHHPFIGLSESTFQSMEHNDASSSLPSTVPAITRLLNIFGDSIHFYPFKIATSYPGGPVSFVLGTVLNQNNINEFKLATANQSLSNLTTRVKNMLNKEMRHADSGVLKKLIYELDPRKNPEKFLLTRNEFESVEESFKKIQAGMEQLLGPQFIEEKIRFSESRSLNEINQQLVDLTRNLYRMAATGPIKKNKKKD